MTPSVSAPPTSSTSPARANCRFIVIGLRSSVVVRRWRPRIDRDGLALPVVGPCELAGRQGFRHVEEEIEAALLPGLEDAGREGRRLVQRPDPAAPRARGELGGWEGCLALPDVADLGLDVDAVRAVLGHA